MLIPASKENGMMPPRINEEKLLPLLINRTMIFIFFMCIVILFLYAIGTNQDFIDTTQHSLLRLYVVFAVFLVTTSVCGIIINIVRFLPQKKTRYLIRAGGYMLPALFGTATLLAVTFIFTLSSGS